MHDSTNEEIRLYIQAAEVAAGATSFTEGMQDGTAPLSFGRPGNWNANYSDAEQDEVGQGAFVLTDAQITCLYNSGLGRSYADLVAGACD